MISDLVRRTCRKSDETRTLARMRTSELGPALDRLDDAIESAVEQFMHQSRPRLQKLAERIGVLAELDPDEPSVIPPQLISLRLTGELHKAARAYLTWHVAETQALGFRNAQIAAALGHASPSNIRGKYKTSEIETALRTVYNGPETGSVETEVNGFRFNFFLDRRFEGAEEPGE